MARGLLSSVRKAQALTRRIFSRYQGCYPPPSRGLTLSMPQGFPRYVYGQSTGHSAHLNQFLGISSVHFHGTATALDDSTIRVQHSKDAGEAASVGLEILSTGSVKPSTSTPSHLRNFDMSILDQFFFNCHTPVLLFFPNSDGASLSRVMTQRSKLLKQSLSEALTRFYPFAGTIRDEFQIDCNDEGVHYVEARVYQSLSDFLTQPNDDMLRNLIMRHPTATETSSGKHVISIQVNVFDCGGIAIGASLTHKIVDGASMLTFLGAWSAAARGSSEVISPSFVASSVFPQSRALVNSLPSELMSQRKTMTRRFLIDSTALNSLRAQAAPSSAAPPSRVAAASALIWKCAGKAASTVRSFGPQNPHVLFSFVNIRKKLSPPLPDESIGSLIIAAVALQFPSNNPQLGELMKQVKDSFSNVSPELVSSFTGEAGAVRVDGLLKMCSDLFLGIDEGDCLTQSSLCRSGLYELDFGWGKPIWFYYMNPGCPQLVTLNDTVKGSGVEATVSLSPEDMAIFERDPELLSYATVDPSPLQLAGLR